MTKETKLYKFLKNSNTLALGAVLLSPVALNAAGPRHPKVSVKVKSKRPFNKVAKHKLKRKYRLSKKALRKVKRQAWADGKLNLNEKRRLLRAKKRVRKTRRLARLSRR